MKKVKKIFALVLVLSTVVCSFFSSSAFASTSAYTPAPVWTKISGYKGNIVLTRGPYTGDLLEGACGFYVEVRSSVPGEDISKLHVVWESSDPSMLSVENCGYSKSSHSFQAYLTVKKGGTHPVDEEGTNPSISATVNGVKLSEEFVISPDKPDVEDLYSYKVLPEYTDELSVGRAFLILDNDNIKDQLIIYEKGITFTAKLIPGGQTPHHIPGLNVTWSSNDPSMFSIKDLGYHAATQDDDDYYSAEVTILKDGVHNTREEPGNPIIYATVNGIQLGQEVYVQPAPVPASSITLTHKAINLVGKSSIADVAFLVNPQDVPLVGKDRNPTVLSYNSKVVKVVYATSGGIFSDGFQIEAVSNGTATVAVQTSSGAKGICIVTVTGC